MFETLTDLGDALLILPASLIFVLYLGLRGMRRTALAWSASLGFCVILVVTAKIACSACGSWVSALDLRSPSGHAAFAMMFYGSGAALLARGAAPRRRLVLGLFAALLIATIAVSRLVLGFHTPAEVVVGLTIGAASVALFCVFNRSATALRPLTQAGLAVFFLLLAVLSHRQHIDAEQWIALLSRQLRTTTAICTAAAPSPSLGLAAHSSS